MDIWGDMGSRWGRDFEFLRDICIVMLCLCVSCDVGESVYVCVWLSGVNDVGYVSYV